jgi:membrane-associated phospholipid phosphatase
MPTTTTLISTIGNPMIIALCYGLYMQWQYHYEYGFKYLPILFVVMVVAPIFGYIFWNVRRRQFADYDVSDRKKRNNLYQFLLPLFCILATILITFQFPLKVILPVLCFILILLAAYFINKTRFKISMHTSFCFLFAYLFYPLNFKIAIGLYFFGFLVLWSRLALNRHSPKEVFAGLVLGNLVGALYLFIVVWFIV